MSEDNTQGTVTEETQVAPEAEETTGSEETQTQGNEDAQKEESFFDPNDLPEELQGQWKRMQGSFTKKMQKLSGDLDKVDAYNRFQSDPEFAKQTLTQAANQMGLTLAQAQAQPATGQVEMSQVPQELVERVRSRLSPEMQWMAEQQAAAAWEVVQMTNKPREDREAQERQQTAESQFNQASNELDGKFPEWRSHEDEMSEWLDFIRSGDMNHPKFGSKLENMFRAATGNSSAVAEAAKRINQAGQNRSATSSVSGRSTSPNVADRVVKAKSNDEAMQIAVDSAMQELEKQGMTFDK